MSTWPCALGRLLSSGVDPCTCNVYKAAVYCGHANEATLSRVACQCHDDCHCRAPGNTCEKVNAAEGDTTWDELFGVAKRTTKTGTSNMSKRRFSKTGQPIPPAQSYCRAADCLHGATSANGFCSFHEKMARDVVMEQDGIIRPANRVPHCVVCGKPFLTHGGASKVNLGPNPCCKGCKTLGADDIEELLAEGEDVFGD